MKWFNINDRLPIKEGNYKVKDKYGNEGFAVAAFIPFTFERYGTGRFDFKVVPCEPYFDGWLIECEGIDSTVKEVEYWAEIGNNVQQHIDESNQKHSGMFQKLAENSVGEEE